MIARVFFTGAFRKPREVNWVFGVLLLFLGMFTGFTGYSLPDDLLSAPACTSWRARSCRSRSSGRTGTSCVPPLRGRTQDGEIAFVLRQFNRSFVFQGQSDIPATADPKFEIDAL